jgi:hypothetical protein
MNWIRKKLILRKWHKSKKRKRVIHLKVRNVLDIFKKIEKVGFRYVVLRWPEEVPVTPEKENTFSDDIDLLTDVNKSDLPTLADIVSRQSGHIVCDLYSLSGRGGTSYLGMPYYPPVLTELILNNRRRHVKGFFIPDPINAFYSFAFHVVYHKGILSGIPTGCDIKTEASPKRSYIQRLYELAQETHVTEIEPPYTLLKLHDYLKMQKWNMPYDLLERWPKKDAWHQYLLDREMNILRPWADKLPGLLVFFIRKDVMTKEYSNLIIDTLSNKFRILHKEKLSEQQIESVIRSVRGGNWLQGKNLELIRPIIAIICYDFDPVPIEISDYHKKENYPLVKNHNVFTKQQIRMDLNRDTSADRELFGIHGSDNEYEAQHMIRAIYGNKTDDMNNYLLAEINKID